MAETLEKLHPDRDLQCYFQQPSAIAALSDTGPDRLTVSGTWRQQFDWAVIEWHRNNVFEHPAFRYLPDGDLSGLTLSYDETRTNCLPIDSDIYPTVDWPYLRVWCDGGESEQFHRVPLKDYASAIEGGYTPATATFTLTGQVQARDYVGIAWISEHHTYQVYVTDTLSDAVKAIVDSVNAFSPVMRAVQNGNSIQLTYVGTGTDGKSCEPSLSRTGANGNRVGAYSYTSAGASLSWSQPWQQFSGGTSPTKWRVTLPFASLKNEFGNDVPMSSVRKLRWTYAADLQSASFQRSEFAVNVSNWTVTGVGREYSVAGNGTRRIENDASCVSYSGTWKKEPGNYSGGTIHHTTESGASATVTYAATCDHSLYLGTRGTDKGSALSYSADGGSPVSVQLHYSGEDFLFRHLLGTYGAGTHTVVVANTGANGADAYFDFLEIAQPAANLPDVTVRPNITAATDWDTDHSIALAPERTARMIHSMGYGGRVNHYCGAMWFYELTCKGNQYASATLTFAGDPPPNAITTLSLWRGEDTGPAVTTIQHLNLIGDTPVTVAKWFEMEINRGYTAIWAQASGPVLKIYSRTLGTDGNELNVSASPDSGDFAVFIADGAFSGGADGTWITDTSAVPALNRAARDWTRSFLAACKSYGLTATAAFSTELRHGDTSVEAGIAQRYPDGKAVQVSTPATQTNFSPVSLAFWQQVYASMAQVMNDAGIRPYLQFGEVQYWYFPNDSGMTFYDDYTKSRFQQAFGTDLAVIPDGGVDPAVYPREAQLLPQLLGEFTSSIMAFVRSTHSDCMFEVLYPVDVNQGAFNRAINFAAQYWTPVALDNLKTESFTFTYARNLNLCRLSIDFAQSVGFPPSKRSHLIGVSDPTSPWIKETTLTAAAGTESIVLFALDQLCLIGYPLEWEPRLRRSFAIA